MWWLTLAAHAFQPPMDAELTVQINNFYGFTAGDFDGDGYDDLIAGDSGVDSSVFRGGPGGISGVVAFRVRGGIGAVGDVDGDGYDDVISTVGTDVMLQRGTANGLSFAYAGDR